MSIYTDSIAIALDMRPLTNEEYIIFIETLKNNNISSTKIHSQNKDKTYEELYGVERAKLLKQNISDRNKGKEQWKS